MPGLSTRRQLLTAVLAGSVSGCLRSTMGSQSQETEKVDQSGTKEGTATQTDLPAKEWTQSFPAPPTTQPLIRDGNVFVGCQDHNLYKIDLQTGQQEFAVDVGDEVGRGLTYAEGVIYGSSPAGVFGIDTETGEITFSTSEQITGFGINTPLVSQGRLYYSSGSRLTAFDIASGDRIWDKRTASWGGQPDLADGTLIVSDAGDTDTIPSEKSRIYGLDPTDGSVQWKTDITSDSLVSAVALSSDRTLSVFVGRYGLTAAFDTATGEERWRATVDRDGNVVGQPVVTQGLVIVPLGGNGIYAYDVTSGSRQWSINGTEVGTGYRIEALNGHLITAKSSLYELAIADGTLKQTHDLSPSVAESLLPAVEEDYFVYPTASSSIRLVKRTQ